MTGAVKLNTAGGGSVVVQPASSIASDVTVNVPSVNGTLVSTGSTAQVSQAMLASGVAGTGPAFSAYLGNTQSVSPTTFVKLQANTEEFDTASCYDKDTNYRFTPNVAGYYQINGQIFFNATGGINNNTLVSIFKNGSRFKDGTLVSGSNGTAVFMNVSTLIYLNGSTDYLELYGLVNGAGTTTFTKDSGTAYQSYFQGCLVRAA